MDIATEIPIKNIYYAGKLTIDADPAAERIFVFNRLTAEMLFFGLLAFHKTAGLMRLTLPETYTNTQNIAVIIMDDGTTYDLTGTDKVQATLTNMVDL